MEPMETEGRPAEAIGRRRRRRQQQQQQRQRRQRQWVMGRPGGITASAGADGSTRSMGPSSASARLNRRVSTGGGG